MSPDLHTSRGCLNGTLTLEQAQKLELAFKRKYGRVPNSVELHLILDFACFAT